MAARRVALSSSRCLGCRQQVLYSFISSFNLPIRGHTQLDTRRPFRGSFAFSSSRLSEQQYGKPDLTQPVEFSEPQEDAATEEAALHAEDVPWYLQQQASEQETNPFAERQKIPELPPNPPPILSPLLNQISIDLGLDYLSFLDLRGLDPPPALGSNLIMIFGSARSDKHVTIAADRLCRWLRANYKLRPFADGLLGRNELKLKLRRRMRRAKMMSAAGGIEPPTPDDGVSNGWICVNVGTVENGPETQPAEEDDGIVGFGSRTDAASIVVQIMTEEKRGDTDLEALWKETLRRADRKRAAIMEEPQQQEEVDQNRAVEEERPQSFRRRRLRQRFPLQHPRPPGAQQIRRFHSSIVPSDAQVVELNTSVSDDADRKTLLEQLKALSPDKALKALGSGPLNIGRSSFLKKFYRQWPSFPDMKDYQQSIDLQCYAIELGHEHFKSNALVWYLRQMQNNGCHIPRETFLQILRTLLSGPHTFDKNSYKILPGEEALHALRRTLGNAFIVLETMENHGYPIDDEEILLMIHESGLHAHFTQLRPGTFTVPSFSAPSQKTVTDKELPTNKVLPDEQTAEGADSAASPSTESDTGMQLNFAQRQRHTHHLRRSAERIFSEQAHSLSIPRHRPSTDFYLRLLISYVPPFNPDPATHDWQSFWLVWRHFATIMRARPPFAYAIALQALAARQRAWYAERYVPRVMGEMANEEVPVRVEGEVRDALLVCMGLVGIERDTRDPVWRGIWDSLDTGQIESGSGSRQHRVRL